jgi:hypothetical protein
MNYIKSVEGFDGFYSITAQGDVISHGGKSNHKQDIVLKPSYDKDGYRHVALKHNKHTKYFRICRLVALHFIANPNGYPVVNHIDENKSNDNFTNLEWATFYKNWKHSENSQAKKEQEVLKLSMEGEVINEYKSLMDAARDANINQGNITNCIKGRCKSVGGFKWKLKGSE